MNMNIIFLLFKVLNSSPFSSFQNLLLIFLFSLKQLRIYTLSYFQCLQKPPNLSSKSKRFLTTRRSLKLPKKRECSSLTFLKDYVDASGSLNVDGKAILHSSGVRFNSGEEYHISLEQLDTLSCLGTGRYGFVQKVFHKPSRLIMAMKKVNLSLDLEGLNQILAELEVLHLSSSPFIVGFCGALYSETSVYFCIEYMDAGSLDKLYPYQNGIPERILSKIVYMIVEGLNFLSTELNIVHRDVKPTNILANTKGEIKLCDFGISGQLLKANNNSDASVGCYEYIAPEKITKENQLCFSPEKSDVWSLGITIVEMATAKYPYAEFRCNSAFAQVAALLQNPPPQLSSDDFHISTVDFVERCLQKVPSNRPDYPFLLNHPFIKIHQDFDSSLMKQEVSEWAKESLSWYQKSQEM